MAVLLADVSGTDRAAGALLRVGAVGDCRAPDMTLRTDPPDLTVAACRDHLRGKCAVERGIPFGGKLRLQRCQIIEACQYLFVPAVRAAVGVPRPVHNRGPPFMPQPALPPDGSVAARHNLRWGQVSVLRGVPLGGNYGKE